MQEAAQNLAQLDASNIWMWVAIGFGNILMIAAATIIMTYYCKNRININATSNQEKHEQSVIEMSPSQVPIPEPTGH